MNTPAGLPELLPCPFCGGKAAINTSRTSDKDMIKLNGRDTGYGVNCIECGTNNRGIWIGYKTPEKATKKWNTRALAAVPQPVTGEP